MALLPILEFPDPRLRTKAVAVDPARLVCVVVGDERVVRSQLDGLGMPVENVDPATLGGQ